jgi:hypothetical protein
LEKIEGIGRVVGWLVGWLPVMRQGTDQTDGVAKRIFRKVFGSGEKRRKDEGLRG